MPSTDPSRRQLLASVATGATVAFAGCNADRLRSGVPGLSADEADSTDDSPVPENAFTDLDVRTLRAAGDDPFITRPDAERPSQRTHVLVDRDDVDSLSFLAEPPGTEAFRSHLDAVDFGTEAAVLAQIAVGQCYDLRAEWVEAEPDSVRAEFCASVKPATVECERGADEVAAKVVTVPRAYSTRPSSVGIGVSANCPAAVEGRSTPADPGERR